MADIVPQHVSADLAPLLHHDEGKLRKPSSDSYTSLGDSDKEEEGHLSLIRIAGINAFVCLYGAVVSAMGVIILPKEMERMFEEHHAIALGMVVGLAGLSQLICPVAGFMSDRCSMEMGRRRPYMIISTAFSSLLILVLWVCREHKWGYLYMVVFLLAMIALNIAYACFTGLVSDIVPDSQMGVASGLMGVLTMLGAGASVAGLGWFIDLSTAYFVYCGLLIVTVAITSISGIETPISDQGPLNWRDIRDSYHISYESHGNFFLVFVGRTLYYVAVSVQTFTLFFLRDVIHIRSADVQERTAVLCLIAQLCAAVVSLPMGYLSDTYGRKRLIYTSCFMMSVTYVGYVFCRDFEHVAILAALYGIGNGTYVAVDYALASQTLPNASNVAKDLGLWGIAAFLGMMLGPVMCGPLLYVFGRTNSILHYSIEGYSVLMTVGAVMSIASATVISRIQNVK